MHTLREDQTEDFMKNESAEGFFDKYDFGSFVNPQQFVLLRRRVKKGIIRVSGSTFRCVSECPRWLVVFDLNTIDSTCLHSK